MNKDLGTIGQVLELTPGDRDSPQWINFEFTALLDGGAIKATKTGTPYAVCILSDPDTGASISATFFGKKFLPPDGSIVTVGGQGLSRTEYNGNAQLSGGAKSTLNVIQQGKSSPPARNAAAPTNRPPPAAQRPAAGNGSPAARNGNGNDYAEGQRLSREGQRIGFAMGKAIDIVESWTGESMIAPGTPEWSTEVWKLASDIIRVAQFLEAGNLAKSPSARANGDNNTGAELSPEEQAAADAEAQAEVQRQEAANRPKPQPARTPQRVAPTSTGAAFEPLDDESQVPF